MSGGASARSSTKPNANPITGETNSTTRVPTSPTGRQPSNPPTLIAAQPPSASAAPTSPPTSACPELDGSPRHHVTRFQAVAPASPAPIVSTATSGSTCTILPIVFATAVPSTTAPSMLKTDESAIAWPGVAPRVATSVAIALAASWNPFVTANASARAIAITRPTSTHRFNPTRPAAAIRSAPLTPAGSY